MSRRTRTRTESSENIFDRFGTVLVPFIGMGQLRFSEAGAGCTDRLLMEDGINPDRKKQSQSFRWLHEIDQILVVGMKYGPRGTQEAVKRVRQLTPELVPAQVWHRMRHLREKERGKSATPVDWSESAIEILRDGYRSGGRKKTEAIKTVRALYPGLAGLRGVEIRPKSRLAGRRAGRQTKGRSTTLDKGRGTRTICARRL